MVDLSANEAASLVKLAARGAGYSWGLCEEAAAAARWLTAYDLPGPQALAALCQVVDEHTDNVWTPTIQGTTWASGGSINGSMLCPLLTGSAVSDRASQFDAGSRIDIHNVISPILLLPFVSDLSLHIELRVQLSWNSVVVECAGQRTLSNVDINEFAQQCIAGDTAPASVTLLVLNDEPEASVEWLRITAARLNLSASCLQQLKQYAHRTYAPNTEHSRLSGAGAGDGDND